jgi:hypothetical protein
VLHLLGGYFNVVDPLCLGPSLALAIPRQLRAQLSLELFLKLSLNFELGVGLAAAGQGSPPLVLDAIAFAALPDGAFLEDELYLFQ